MLSLTSHYRQMQQNMMMVCQKENKRTKGLVSPTKINTQRQSCQFISSQALSTSRHFFKFLSISHLIRKNGNMPVKQTMIWSGASLITAMKARQATEESG